MTSPSPPLRELLREDYDWTPRQHQVLGLLAAGKTNHEIAGALGISLDGAKWHVREVLSKLNVQSRDEAAEYWRAYNGWPQRLRRDFGAVAAAGLGKWAGAAGVLAAGAALVAAGVIFYQSGGDTTPPSSDATPPAQPAATAPTVDNGDATPIPTAAPAPIAGIFTAAGEREPDETFALPELQSDFPEPQGSAAIFDIAARETIDLGDGWLPVFSPGGTKAAYVAGDVGPGVTLAAEIRVMDLATRAVRTVHSVPGAAISLAWDTGPDEGNPPFWWFDDELLAVYHHDEQAWRTIHAGSGESGVLRIQFERDPSTGMGSWHTANLATGESTEHPADEGMPRDPGVPEPPPRIGIEGLLPRPQFWYEVDPSGGAQPGYPRVIREVATGNVIAEIAAYDVVALDEHTVLAFADLDVETFRINLFAVDLRTLEAEFVTSTFYPPSTVSVVDLRVWWTERPCGMRDAAYRLDDPRESVEPPGDSYVYDHETGTLTRIDNTSVRQAGRPVVFLVPVGSTHAAVTGDEFGVRAIVDGRTFQAEVVLPVPASNWTADRAFAVTGRVSVHNHRCTGSSAVFVSQSYLHVLEMTVGERAVRVDTPGSCLNLREEPSTGAAIIRCYPDGAAFFVREVNAVPEWLPVRTLDGNQGWVSEEFVVAAERGRGR